jgi:hypothetical protein
MTLLASDIARRIQQPDEDPVRVLNRVRNWTKFGLLKPAGEANPGGGRACVYPESALLEAMLLQELINAGMPAVSMRPILDKIQDAVSPAKLAKQDSDQTLLILGKHRSSSNVINVWLRSPEEFAKLVGKHECALFYILNLKPLRDRLIAA